MPKKSSTPSTQPIASWKKRGVHVSVFKNVSEKNGSVYCKTSVSRVFKDESGEFKTTSSFSAADIPVLQMLLAKAFEVALDAEAEANKNETQE
jgi:hypothetical protein